VSFRRRLTFACAAAVAVAVALAAALTYGLVADQLRGQIDNSLREAGEMAARVPEAGTAADRFKRSVAVQSQAGSPLDGPVAFVQLISDKSDRLPPAPPGEPPLNFVSKAAVAGVAAGTRPPFITDVRQDGRDLRVLTTRLPGGGVLQVARSLDEVNQTLGTLRLGLAGIVLLGIAAALLLARLATRAAVKPVAQLTETAEQVARTRDLTHRIAHTGDDELSRMAGAFNTMLEALEASQRAQRRLVADASHELRTPLTSLRTNLEVQARGGLDPADAARLRADVIAQLEELTLLVSDLVDLAREDEPVAEQEVLRLDELVAAAVERARRHAPGVTFATALEPVLVEGARSRLDRAVANLLDNAAKHGAGQVEVSLDAGGRLRVRDHGPGIAGEDLPFVFDRFYRAPAARGRPGSGLGLAIVRQAAEAHGGRVDAAIAPEGGAELRMTLPVADATLASATS
jgi:two-component system sensor histidine kinase MprB